MLIKTIRFLLSLSSFSWMLFFLLVWKKIDIPYVNLTYKYLSFLNNFVFIKYVIIFIFFVFFAWFVLWVARKYIIPSDNVKVIDIKPIEWTFLPVYIGLFVIALSFDNNLYPETIFLLLILFIFWLFLESVSYFNPFFLIFWYRFYEIKSESNITIILIIKRKDLKIINEIDWLRRINNFTYLKV